ncbi:MAG: LURP-one-related family protein [Clostridia bacterium]|nr:LURP-one-related family protein [Clostridia bacterium]
MKLLFKQRFFSWFDSYDIYNENGDTVFTVEGKLSWGHKLHILNCCGEHIATVKQVVLTFMPRFELYEGDRCIGSLQKKISFFKPHYEIDFNGWSVSGNFLEWDYNILDRAGRTIAVINKELFNFTDTYSIETANDADALYALMVTLAIDAEKCSRN